MSKRTVFISYSWNDSAFADSIEKALVSFGVKVIRDKNELKYKSNLTEFMNSIRESDYIVMIIGDSYLKSENCMYEALEAVKERNFINKVLPIVLESANIYKTEEQLKYITHWNNKKIELENQCKTLPQTAIIPIIDNLKKIENITSQINDFMATFKDMIQISTSKIKNEDYQELLEHLKFDLGEMSKILLSSNNEKYSNLKIKGVKDGEISDSFHIYDYQFKFNQNYLENLEILKQFYNNIKNIPIKAINTNNSAILDEFSFLKKLMAGTNYFEFDDNFFNVGNIGVKNNFIINDSTEITENEKHKYKLLKHFELLFIYIYQFSIYSKRIESYKMVDFILLNNGKSIDEDMEITLYFPKDSIVTNLGFPSQKDEEVRKDFYKLIDYFFQPKATHKISNYPDYENWNLIAASHVSFRNRTNLDLFERQYNDKWNHLFKYNFFSNSEYDILKFNQNYLKHNSCNFIPSTIILKNSIDYIKYEITSKHYPEVITGVLSAKV